MKVFSVTVRRSKNERPIRYRSTKKQQLAVVSVCGRPTERDYPWSRIPFLWTNSHPKNCEPSSVYRYNRSAWILIDYMWKGQTRVGAERNRHHMKFYALCRQANMDWKCVMAMGYGCQILQPTGKLLVCGRTSISCESCSVLGKLERTHIIWKDEVRGRLSELVSFFLQWIWLR